MGQMARIKPGEASTEWEEYLLGLGDRIRQCRSARNMTQRDLGDAAGTSSSYIYQIEMGKQNVTLELIWKIANGLGIRLDVLLSSGEIWEEPTEKSVRQLSEAVGGVREELVAVKERDEHLVRKVERLTSVSEKLLQRFSRQKERGTTDH
jgi:transcriptional regulator with XRE-family HTH domain